MPTADLSVTMDDGKTTVVPGTTDTYTIIVTNNDRIRSAASP